jgi:hypothetical protein
MNYGPDAIRWVGDSVRVVSKTTYASHDLVSQARDYMLYLSLFEILGRMELSRLDAYQEVQMPSSPSLTHFPNYGWSWSLPPFVLQLQLQFRNHPDLCEELEKFRPPLRIKHPTNNIWPWVIVCAVPLVAVSLIPALGNPVLWFVQQTIGEKMATWFKLQRSTYICSYLWLLAPCIVMELAVSLYIYICIYS